MREEVAARAGKCCEYCQSQEEFSPDRFQIDRIHPSSRGGSDSIENLALSCGGCNNAKSDFILATDPESREKVTLFNPRDDAWEIHFQWRENFTRIEGITDIGRATEVALALNRLNLIRLREVLRRAGAHPPEL